jgi:ferrochelatase
MSDVDSVLLVAFGGPERPDDVRPFLEIVTAGRRVPPERLDEVARHYERIGGRSPLPELTREQARALARALRDQDIALPVHVGMRNWHPFLHETLAAMQGAGHRRALAIIMSPFQTEASWDRYVADVDAAREKVGGEAPEVVFARPWADHPLFLKAMAARVDEALGALADRARSRAHVIFTAHSVPVAMAEGSPYAAQFEGAARVVAGRVGHAHWSVAYQSRSGSPRDPWLGPDVGDAIRTAGGLGASDVVLAPIGFVCDHVEVLYDLDVEARAVAEGAGLGFHRAAAANAHPTFVAMLADLVGRVLGR